jgi:NADH dehydrogenase
VFGPMTPGSQRSVAIVGAGFAGLACARSLQASAELTVTLIDQHPYQLFAPLLYQVATGGLPEDDIAYPVRAAIPGINFVRGEVTKVNPGAGTLRLASGVEIPWDDLVLATGSIGNSFNIPGVDDHALQMKNLQQARAIKHRLLGTYERVHVGEQPKEDLGVVVVGGGPTGVEVAGAVAELQKQMTHEFPSIAGYAHVTLVEAGPRLLPSFSPKSSDRARQALEKLGVEVILDAAVDRMYPTDVHLKNGRVLPAGTTIWAAGVAAETRWTVLGDSDRLNRLVVDECLRLQDNVWVIGDMAHVEAADGRPLPMVASVALQQGKYVAKAIMSASPPEPFRYKDKGQMATVGRRLAVVELPNGFRLHGTLAWLSWLALHVAYLAGGRNRVSVIADWVWNYIAWGSGARRTIIE